MCNNGVNTNQLKSTIEQIDECIALNRRWTHRLFHLADDGGQDKTAAKLKEVQSLLDDARALLDEARDAVDDDSSSGVSVELV